MCEEGLHDPFQDQVDCARFRAERDALAQRMEEVASEIDRTLSGVEGIEDAPAMRWARRLREALGALHSPRTSYEDIEAAKWVRDHGGLDSVKKLLDWVIGHCSTKQQLDFDFWLSGRVMYELGFGEDMADREEVERRLLARLMPEGMEWPRYESGEPVRIGDVVNDVEVRSVVFRDNGILLSDCTSVPGWGTWRSYKEPIERPAPKVLDADGAEIRAGDRVWSTHIDEPHEWIVIDPHEDRDDSQTVLVSIGDRTGHARPEDLTHRAPVLAADGEPLEVGQTVWDANGDELVIGALEDGGNTVTCRYADVGDGIPVHGMWSPSQLTHQRPDSWEKLEQDAEKDPCGYFGFDGEEPCGKCPASGKNCEQTMALDIVRRARALAERGE